MATFTIGAALDTFQQAANRGTAVYLSSALVQELRKALEADPEGPVLQWTDNMSPCEACRYDHCIAETPFGRFLITWKSWKDDCPTVDETPWGVWLGAFDSVDDAKTACQQEMNKRLARWCTPAAPPAPAPSSEALADPVAWCRSDDFAHAAQTRQSLVAWRDQHPDCNMALYAHPQASAAPDADQSEGPSLDDVYELCAEFGFHLDDCSGESAEILRDMITAAITRWCAPVAEPVPAPEPEGEGVTEEQWDALLELAWDKYETVGYQGERFMWAGDFGSALDFVRQEIARHGQKLAPPVDQPVATPGPGEPETEPGEAGGLAARLTLISEGMSAMDQEEDSWFVARGAIVIAQQAAKLAALRGVPVAVSERLPEHLPHPKGQADAGEVQP